MPPRRKRSCITVLREYRLDDVDVNETPVAVAVETEEIVSTVVTTSIRRGRARSSKRQRFEKEGDRLVEKPIENPVDAATANPEGDINEQDVRAYLGYPDAGRYGPRRFGPS